eukprot:8917379-Pyramimonas_sp.AAC.1
MHNHVFHVFLGHQTKPEVSKDLGARATTRAHFAASSARDSRGSTRAGAFEELRHAHARRQFARAGGTLKKKRLRIRKRAGASCS